MLSTGKGTQTRHARSGVAAQPVLANGGRFYTLPEDKTVKLLSQKHGRNK